MSIHLGPTLEWAPGFEIAPPLGKFPTASVFIPETACNHCSHDSRETSYLQDIRNIYRTPPLHGFPYGIIPRATLNNYTPYTTTSPTQLDNIFGLPRPSPNIQYKQENRDNVSRFTSTPSNRNSALGCTTYTYNGNDFCSERKDVQRPFLLVLN